MGSYIGIIYNLTNRKQKYTERIVIKWFIIITNVAVS